MDFPQPEGPINAVILFFSNSRSTPLIASLSPYQTCRSFVYNATSLSFGMVMTFVSFQLYFFILLLLLRLKSFFGIIVCQSHERRSKTAMINTAEAPAETETPSGIVPSVLIFQIWTASVSAWRKMLIGLETLNGFQFVKSNAGAL